MLPAGMRVFVATDPIDLRISFDRLAGLVRDAFGADPRGGALFCFRNKASDRCKVLFYDRSGYCVLYKRLDAGTFQVPKSEDGKPTISVDGEALARILEGIPKPPRANAKSPRPRIH